jgi:hypothetical protein
MSEYVESNYNDEGYAEGDTLSPSAQNVDCDLSAIMEKMQLLESQNQEIKAQNTALNEKLELLFSTIKSNNTLNLNITDKLSTLYTKIPDNLHQIVTTDYIDTKVPFVDDMCLDVYPKGAVVVTSIANGFFTVESSKFLPDGQGGYSVVYTLSKEIDGEKRHSEFHASYVRLGYPEEFFKKSDYPDQFPDYVSSQ